MLQTITKVKGMNIIELLEHASKHHKHGKMFESKNGRQVFVNESGFRLDTAEETQTIIWFNETFEVEIEEPITEDTEFEWLVKITTDNDLYSIPNVALENIKSSTAKHIYALINGRLELVWERDEDE